MMLPVNKMAASLGDKICLQPNHCAQPPHSGRQDVQLDEICLQRCCRVNSRCSRGTCSFCSSSSRRLSWASCCAASSSLCRFCCLARASACRRSASCQDPKKLYSSFSAISGPCTGEMSDASRVTHAFCAQYVHCEGQSLSHVTPPDGTSVAQVAQGKVIRL